MESHVFSLRVCPLSVFVPSLFYNVSIVLNRTIYLQIMLLCVPLRVCPHSPCVSPLRVSYLYVCPCYICVSSPFVPHPICVSSLCKSYIPFLSVSPLYMCPYSICVSSLCKSYIHFLCMSLLCVSPFCVCAYSMCVPSPCI